MPDEDDEFWTTYIASTPEEDRDFAIGGQASAWIFLAMLSVFLVVWLLLK
jgi:hypothetical protein